MTMRWFTERVAAAAVIVAATFTWTATAAQAEICDCPTSLQLQVPDFDAAAHLTQEELVASLGTHLPWGIHGSPADSDSETLIVQRHFVVNYDADLNTPTWVAYRLTADDVDEHAPGHVTRIDCFRDFPRVGPPPEDTPPRCSDYDNDSFDRGHLVPSGDMLRSRTANANTFFLTNMGPQFANFNRKIWQTLENEVRSWAADSPNPTYIITGAVFDHDGDGERDPDATVRHNDGDERIAVASHWYKIVMQARPTGFIDVIAIMLPHTNESVTGDDRWPYLRSHITTIATIEDLTGIFFLPQLEATEPNKAAAIKWFRAPDLW